VRGNAFKETIVHTVHAMIAVLMTVLLAATAISAAA
jgi:hypothetical protein